MKGTHFRPKDIIEDIDLRTVSARSSFLRKMAQEGNIRGSEILVFTNKKQNRFRYVAKIGRIHCLVIPEVDENTRRTLYLLVSEECARLSGSNSLRERFHEIVQKAKERNKRWDNFQEKQRQTVARVKNGAAKPKKRKWK